MWIQGRLHPIHQTGRRYLYYNCNGRHKRDTVYSCDMPPVRADRIDKLVWDSLCTQLLDEQRLNDELERQQCEAAQERVKLDREINELVAARVEVE